MQERREELYRRALENRARTELRKREIDQAQRERAKALAEEARKLAEQSEAERRQKEDQKRSTPPGSGEQSVTEAPGKADNDRDDH